MKDLQAGLTLLGEGILRALSHYPLGQGYAHLAALGSDFYALP